MTVKVSSNLASEMKKLDMNSATLKQLHKSLAESEGRFADYVLADFGSVKNYRKRTGKAPKPVRDAQGNIDGSAQADNPLPVATGRFVRTWNYKQKGLSATLENKSGHAEYARLAGEKVGKGAEKVGEFIEEDWTGVAEEMADIMAERFTA